ncbi:hypothetical protein PAXRUDRAFT_371199 [Paxillus rubicundulus Ve08.2h10]|uniref:Uncharacterized protein n=1 Tax=Paxillus rubicundulus Ve08.2h10 TaxID=930991 RepID=A0A0D0DMP6_9AGAM|nr:hypothetical protein PAXRUDRAFT_371199 [Paxillus rubicundulus Ve08.2h10]
MRNNHSHCGAVVGFTVGDFFEWTRMDTGEMSKIGVEEEDEGEEDEGEEDEGEEDEGDEDDEDEASPITNGVITTTQKLVAQSSGSLWILLVLALGFRELLKKLRNLTRQAKPPPSCACLTKRYQTTFIPSPSKRERLQTLVAQWFNKRGI